MWSNTTFDNCRGNILKGVKRKRGMSPKRGKWVVNVIIVNAQVVVVRRHVDCKSFSARIFGDRREQRDIEGTLMGSQGASLARVIKDHKRETWSLLTRSVPDELLVTSHLVTA